MSDDLANVLTTIIWIVVAVGICFGMWWLTLYVFIPWTKNSLILAGRLLAWALEAGFIGLMAYIAAWVFLFPVMLIVCVAGGLLNVYLDHEAAVLERYLKSRSGVTPIPNALRVTSDSDNPDHSN